MKLLPLIVTALLILSPALAWADCTSPAKVAGEIIFNSATAVLQYCNGTDWVAMGGNPLGNCHPTNSPVPGQVCGDGSVYAGLSPDGNVPMYTSPADAAGLYRWSSAGGNTAMEDCISNPPGAQASCRTGQANTTFLVGATAEPLYPFPAAEYCDGLAAYGHSDWYLPAQDELFILYTNRASIGGFNLSGSYPGGWYASSSENTGTNLRNVNFSNGSIGGNKSGDWVVRCVRQGYVTAVDFNFSAGCTNPAASAGKIIYNTDQNLMQYCNGAQWIAMGKPSIGGPGCTNPTRNAGAMIFNSTCSVMQYCNGAGWIVIGPSPNNGCECGNPLPGAVCADGSVYAGLSPDGNVPMYTTPADAGLFAWNDANSTGYTTTNQTSFVTGQANTAALLGLDSNSAAGGVQPHRAAQHCADLVAYGQSDWHLPALNELNVLYLNRAAIGGFNLSGSFPAGWYWSSSESNSDLARGQRFGPTPFQGFDGKQLVLSVRCVRKEG